MDRTRWAQLRPHAKQSAFYRSEKRFIVVVAGRRSGKSEIAKRKMARKVVAGHSDARFFMAAPTRDQAKTLFWEDMRKLIPARLVRRVEETTLTIHLVHGPRLVIVGLDKPQRIEGTPWDGGLIDEFADVKPQAWSENIRPALSDRQGFCWFTGVPEGRGNHLYDFYKRGQEGMAGNKHFEEWESYHWLSEEILPESEIESAKYDLDVDTFQQEYCASFVSFRGRVYKRFTREEHCVKDLFMRCYSPTRPLVFSFDFNVSPGAGLISQYAPKLPNSGLAGFAVLGEVAIPRDSDSERLAFAACESWAGHQGEVILVGDAAGKHRSTSGDSDWEIVRHICENSFPGRVSLEIPDSNPLVVDRVNTVNAAIKNAHGNIRLAVDAECVSLIEDLESVSWKEGSNRREISKKDIGLTHWTDCLGYQIWRYLPVLRQEMGKRTARGRMTLNN